MTSFIPKKGGSELIPTNKHSEKEGIRGNRGTGSDKSQDTKSMAVHRCPLRVLALYGNEAVWHTPHRVV